LVASDSLTGRPIGGILARGETQEEVTYFLTQLKPLLIEPLKFITIDFSKTLKTSAKQVFPDVIIGHDLFHTVQLLNRGTLKELMRLQKQHYNIPIKDFNTIRKKSMEAEKTGNLPNYNSIHNPYLTQAWDVFRQVSVLLQCKSLKEFKQSWKSNLNNILKDTWTSSSEFYNELCKLESNQIFTKKNYIKIPRKVFMIWRRIVRKKREELEENKGDFIKAKYCILMNPKNMGHENRRDLKKYLQSFPWMRPIRICLTEFYSQFKLDQKHPRSLIFLRKMIQPDSHKDLIAAIDTIIECEQEIYAYRQIWNKFPSLRNKVAIRSNHEEKNRKINKVALNQYGLRGTESARIRLKGILDCPIIVSKALLTSEQNDL
jgi:hypothetical protein